MAPLPANGSLGGNSEPPPLPSTSAGSLAIFSLTFLLGFPGNGLVIWAVALKVKRTVTTVWFLHLAIADFLCCLSLPFSIAQLALGEHWPFGWFLCKVLPSAIIFNMFASVFLLTAISLDRCLLVTKPVWCQNHRTVRLASAVCGVIWILAFLLCCPSFFYRETVEDEFGNTRCLNNWKTGGHDANDQWFYDLWDVEDDTALLATGSPDTESLFPGGSLDPPPSYPTAHTIRRSTVGPLGATERGADSMWRPATVPPSMLPVFPGGVHPSLPTASISQFQDQPADYFPEGPPPGAFVSTTVTRAVFGFLLPFAVMAACYALIARRMLTKLLFVGPRRRALQLILLVMATFFLCWAPYHVTGVLFLLAAPQTSLHQALLWWDSVSVALAYANSCINPLLYVFVGRQFRREIRQTVQEMFEGAFADPSSPACSQDKRQTSTAGNEVDVSVL